MKVIFMGTPDFAVESLRAICDAGYDVVGVVTMPDKPAGRGQKMQMSAVKQFALERALHVMQPERLRDEAFLAELRSLQADVQVVVAFRMLPEVVWSMPPKGTFNLHASLLPQYRGAAPINWAIINGDTQTGVTTFMLDEHIDTGAVMMRRAVDILPSDDAGTLHDKLMTVGAELVLKTLEQIEQGQMSATQQSTMTEGEVLRHAPKIFKEDMRIDWRQTAVQVHNLVRGMSPYPAAWTEFPTSDESRVSVKIFRTTITNRHDLQPGQISTDGKTHLLIGTQDVALQIEELQAAGKKRMDVGTFVRGFRFGGDMKID